MRLGRFFLPGSKLPDLIVLPMDLEKPRKDAADIEKILFYREKSRGRSKVLIVSKKVLEKLGGLESGLGFGEDRIWEKKLFSLFGMSYKERRKFRI